MTDLEQRLTERLRRRDAEIERLRSELSAIRIGVCKHATETAWCGPGETVVDRVSAALSDGDWYNDVYLKTNT